MAVSVDTRKLKDSVTEFFKKGKFEKAAAALEDLIKAEPKETAHRLKLGDALRKVGERDKSIAAYQAAAKSYADEGQLIKAIAAVKVILEIDPANQAAQNQLAEMNERRFMRPGQFMQKAAPPKPIGAGARATTAIELDEGHAVAASIAEDIGGKAFENDAEPLELDEPEPPARRPPPQAAKAAPRPPPKAEPVEAIDLPEDLPAAPKPQPQQTTRRGQPLPAPLDPLELDEAPLELTDVEPEIDLLDVDSPAAQKIAAAAKAAKEEPPPPVDESGPIEVELTLVDAEPDTAPIKVQASVPQGKGPTVTPLAVGAHPPTDGGIDLDLGLQTAAAAARAPQPIADLLATTGEHEVELVAILSDDEPSVAVPKVTASPEDLDAAFSNIVDEPAKPQRKVPARVPLFSDLSQDAFVDLVNKLDYRVYQPGEIILREGDPGRSFYVISEGKVRVFKKLPDGQELTLATLEEGAFFGEMAMLSGAPRTATIAAETETHVLEVTDKVLRSLVEKHPQVTATLKNFYRQRLLNNVMAISPLFKSFDAGERKSLMEKFRMRQATAGEVLIEQGKKSDGLYVVLHGAVNVTATAGDGLVELATLKEGDIFGEMSLLTHKPATATVAAAVPALLLKLPREGFQEMILTHPQILELISELTDQRRSATEAILKGHGPGVDGMAFV